MILGDIFQGKEVCLNEVGSVVFVDQYMAQDGAFQYLLISTWHKMEHFSISVSFFFNAKGRT